MKHVTLIYPCVGREPGRKYVRSWQMQPLAIAMLASETPDDWAITFFDDRLENIDFAIETDLVAISVETYTARRAYQIATRFRKRGIRVVMGGGHVTVCPEEALDYADAVCIGEAEGVWPRILADAAAGQLQERYRRESVPELCGIKPDRRIFEGKRYFKLALVETGRGCPFQCHFCAIAAVHQGKHRTRPVEEVVEEIRGLKEKFVFFVDDNLTGNVRYAKELFRALKGCGILWISQASIHTARDKELLALMRESGCLGMLIGFESIEPANLRRMGKGVNKSIEYHEAMENLREAGLVVYGTFIFGYENDSTDLYKETVHFAEREQIFMAAFNHLMAFPGTELYHELKAEGTLVDQWWLREDFRFGDMGHTPTVMPGEQIKSEVLTARRRFYSFRSIWRRAKDRRANTRSPLRLLRYLGINLMLRREIKQKAGIPMGDPAEPAPEPRRREEAPVTETPTCAGK